MSFQKRIETFWNWWEANADAFAADVDKGLASNWSELLSERIAEMHPEMAWETGPGRQSSHHLAISGEGDAELRVAAERIVSRAPKASAHWEYYAARQRSSADPVMCIEFNDGLEIDYGLMSIQIGEDDRWKCLDLTVFHPAFERIDGDRAKSIALLFLEADGDGSNLSTKQSGRGR